MLASIFLPQNRFFSVHKSICKINLYPLSLLKLSNTTQHLPLKEFRRGGITIFKLTCLQSPVEKDICISKTPMAVFSVTIHHIFNILYFQEHRGLIFFTSERKIVLNYLFTFYSNLYIQIWYPVTHKLQELSNATFNTNDCSCTFCTYVESCFALFESVDK